VATWSGVNKITGNIEDPKSWERFTKKNTNGGLSDDWVYSMEITDEGDLWFGTEYGLSFYDGKQWKNWTNKDGLGGAPDILKEENKEYADNVFQGAHHANQANYTGMQNLNIATFNPNHITGMKYDDKTGILWIGTWGGGLSRFDGKKFISFTKRDGLASNYVLSVTQSSDGSIWLGTDNGVNRLKNDTFDLFTTQDGLLTDFTFVVKIDEKGRLWAGGPGGVSLVKNI
ncbi:MAG: two-component regulator propeller domain-containing protein, partial [Nitrospinota bacterium]